MEEIYLRCFSAAKVVIFGLLWDFLLFASVHWDFCMRHSVPQWWGLMLWSGPSRAVHVEISAVLCKSTLSPLILIFTCSMSKGSAEWLDYKCFAVKYQTYNMVTPLSGCSGDFVWMGHWRLCVQAGKCKRCCSAWQKEMGHFPPKCQFWLCPTDCSRWWGHLFCWINRSRQHKLNKYDRIHFWVQKLQVLLRGEIHACARKMLKSNNQSSSFCP